MRLPAACSKPSPVISFSFTTWQFPLNPQKYSRERVQTMMKLLRPRTVIEIKGGRGRVIHTVTINYLGTFENTRDLGTVFRKRYTVAAEQQTRFLFDLVSLCVELTVDIDFSFQMKAPS